MARLTKFHRQPGREPGSPSSEAENRSRGRHPLERGGESPEGVRGLQSKWRFARGGVFPSGEAEILPRGHLLLERGGDLPEGATAPRAR
jgi:hypothetical protein